MSIRQYLTTYKELNTENFGGDGILFNYLAQKLGYENGAQMFTVSIDELIEAHQTIANAIEDNNFNDFESKYGEVSQNDMIELREQLIKVINMHINDNCYLIELF